jgi:hypothetical protein
MATKLSRPTLKQLFSDGERPTGDNFESAWMSFLNQNDDQISYDATNNNIALGPTTGLVLGNPTTGATAGTLRFNSGTGTIQFYDGTIFKDISSGAGAFLPVGGGPAVAFSGGNVGIGTAAVVPTHKLEIPLADNSGPSQEVLLGNTVIHNGPVAAAGAYIGNAALASNATGYALFQDNVGKTRLNASNANNSQLSLAINGVDKFLITQQGDIQLSPTTSVAVVGDVTIGSVFTPHNLDVYGNASKTTGTLWTALACDNRVKKDIRPYAKGLQKLLELNPAIFKYNGKGGTMDDDKDYVGLIAQDVQKVMPELTRKRLVKMNPDDTKDTEILTHDLSDLIFVFINAFKELNARLEQLENPKKNEKGKPAHTS